MNENVTSRAVRLATVHDPDGGKTTVRLTIEVLGGTAHGFSADAMVDTISVMVEGADADDLGAAEEAISGGRGHE